MFWNPPEGPESSATFALLMLIIPIHMTSVRAVFVVCGHPTRQERAGLESSTDMYTHWRV